MGRELRKTVKDGVELWAIHETVSEVEGAITPGFRTKEELIEHLVTHGTLWDEPWSRAAAEDFVNRSVRVYVQFALWFCINARTDPFIRREDSPSTDGEPRNL